MNLVSTKTIAKVAAVATGLAMAASVLSFAPMAQAAGLTSTQISSILSLLSSFGADSATIANVNAALTGAPVTTTTTTTSTSSSCSFTRDLTTGVSGADVTCLQQALIAAGYSIPAGATGYFGAQTVAAVSAWQKAVGVAPAVGYFGAISRAHWNLGGSTTTTTTGTGTVTVGSGNGLKVALSPTSPSGTVLVQGQGIGDLGDFVFSNPTSQSITVTGLTFNRIGVSNDQTIDNVYLYQGVNRITDAAGVSNSQFSYNNAAGLFVVPAGTTYTVSVRADIDATNTSGQQIGASLVSVASTGTLDSSDSFPINSGLQTISSANLATVSFATSGNTLPAADTTVSLQSSYPVWQNTIAVSTNAVWLKSLKLTNLGSADASALTNLRLYVDGTQVGNSVSQLNSDRTVLFDLSASPVQLSTQSHVIKVLADVVGGANRTFQFSLQRSSDVMLVDSQLNQPVTSKVNSQNFSAVTAHTVTVQSASAGVSVTRDPASPTNDIAVGASSVKLASFDFLATGEPTKVSDLLVYASSTTSGGALAGVGGINNGKIFVNGVQVGSTRDIGSLTANATDFSLGSSMILPAGQTTHVDIYGDAQDTAGTNLPSGASVVVTIKADTSNAQGQVSLVSTNVPAGDVSGNSINVTSSSLTATKATGYGNQAVVSGTSNFKVGSFVLSAGSTDNLNVSSIGIVMGGTGTSSLQNLRLVDESTGQALGSTIPSPGTPASAGTQTFSTNLIIPASGTKTIDVYADVPSGTSNADTIILSVSHTATSATGATTGTTATIGGSDVTLQTITVGSGSLNVALGAGNPVASNVVAGSSNLQVGDYTFSANTSSYTVKKLELAMPSASSSAVSSVSIQYKDSTGATQTASAALTTSGATSTAKFSGLSFYVPANSSADVTAWVSTPTITTGASTISGTKIAFSLIGVDGTNVQVQDASGNVTSSINGGVDINSAGSGYGFLVLRKSVPTFSSTGGGGTSAPNTSTTLYQFTVSADPAGAVDFDKFSFNVSTSSGVTLGGFQLYDAANPSIALNASGAPSAGGVVTITTDQVVQIPAGGSKTFILKASTGIFGSGAQNMSVNLAPADSTLIANTTAPVTGNYSWTDRSANSDSTSASQWTNGYLLRNLSGSYSFTTSS